MGTIQSEIKGYHAVEAQLKAAPTEWTHARRLFEAMPMLNLTADEISNKLRAMWLSGLLERRHAEDRTFAGKYEYRLDPEYAPPTAQTRKRERGRTGYADDWLRNNTRLEHPLTAHDMVGMSGSPFKNVWQARSYLMSARSAGNVARVACDSVSGRYCFYWKSDDTGVRSTPSAAADSHAVVEQVEAKTPALKQSQMAVGTKCALTIDADAGCVSITVGGIVISIINAG